MYNSNLTLKSILEQRQGQGFSETEVINIMQHILPQLEHLHLQGKTQGNISLDNLFFSNNQVLLSVNESNYHQDNSKDIYDLGLVLIELLTAKSPHQILNLTTGETWDDFCVVSDNLLNLINKMIAPFPERFNSINEILMSLNYQNNYHTAPTIISPNYNSSTINSQPNYSNHNSPTVVYPNYEQNNTINQSSNQVKQIQNKITTRLLILLTVIIVIGISSAIALPSFLSRGNKEKQAVAAKSIINMIVNRQVKSYQEVGKFQSNLEDLEISINSENNNYKYEVKLLDENKSILLATPEKKGLLSFIGVTFISNDNIIYAICSSQEPSVTPPQIPDLTNSNFQCSPDSTLISDINNIPVPDQFIPRPSPEQAVVNYYDTINQQKYQTGWELLTPELRSNTNSHPEGFNSYLDWWTQVRYVNVLNTKLVNQTTNNSTVLTDLTYHLKSGRIVNQTLEFNFVWDSDRKQWLVDRVKRQ